VIPREGVESSLAIPSHISGRSTVIPREGVERLREAQEAESRYYRLVIPREGVESLLSSEKICNIVRHRDVIPREGVESSANTFNKS